MFYYSRCAHLAAISSVKPMKMNTAKMIAAEIDEVLQLLVCTPVMMYMVEKQVSGTKNQQANPRQKEQTLRKRRVFTLQAMSFTSRSRPTAPATQQRAGDTKYPYVQEKSPAVQQLLVKEGMKESQLQPRYWEKLVSPAVLKMDEKRNSICAKQMVREQWRPRRVVRGARASPVMATIWPARVQLGRKLINIYLFRLGV